jgi:hypothetical protein
MTIHDLVHEFQIKPRTIHKYVAIGLLPRPVGGRGLGATYLPECRRILRDLDRHKNYRQDTLADLAERRQLTGSIVPNFDHPAP